ncbi:hypothetical protein [Leucobacter tenebrionis]|uniref:hypothetical protein n=1 Tax=Leucobacter tenebrionis TaxID=2873270 RepID=UPI001CA6C0FB|nr:hypothetical protein [Leucobacter tenebrionis]QZY52892.1 hypothetical protein KVY00_05515 [Leucobacter tenebrionis]
MSNFIDEKTGMSDLVVGILLAILASTVIPWVTSLASAWLEARRDLKNRRRELFERMFVTNVRDNFRTPATDAEERQRDIDSQNKEANAAVTALRSSFGLFDKTVEKVAFDGWSFRKPDDPKFEMLRLWANGHVWIARWKARKLAKADISSSPDQQR